MIGWLRSMKLLRVCFFIGRALFLYIDEFVDSCVDDVILLPVVVGSYYIRYGDICVCLKCVVL